MEKTIPLHKTLGINSIRSTIPFVLLPISSFAQPSILIPLCISLLVLTNLILLVLLIRLKKGKGQLHAPQIGTSNPSDAEELKQRIAKLESTLVIRDKELAILNSTIEEAKRVADEADLLKSNFLANMSHEIRTPMNGILGFAQLLLADDTDDDKRARYLDIINHNGTMLVNLIDDIMDISRIEAGQLALNRSLVNVDDIMFELYAFFNEIKFKQEKEHITIRLLNLNDDINSSIYTDGLRLRQVLTNLIGNALKFTEKGVVEFGYTVNTKRKGLDFFVRDSGIGIPPDKREVIFERFRQGQEGSTRKYGGTGIGLFISKRIVNLLGGEITLESTQGVGSTFFFNIPFDEVEGTDYHAPVYRLYGREYNWEGKTILIAEDVHCNFELLNSILSDTKASIVWAQDGEEVVKLCSEMEGVDVVLMDIQMPKLNGYDAVARIKGVKPQLPIIAQTAYSMPNDNLKALEVGCNDYISKPINSHLLLEKIEAQLKGSRVVG